MITIVFVQHIMSIAPASIFKAYDIRGLVDSELSVELFYRLGRAAALYTGAKNIFVGYDMRPSSRPFADALIRGLTDQGANATDIGLISTPMLNILTIMEPSVELGIMITASHNPEEYNGCKFVNKKTMMPIGLDNGLAEMRALIDANDFPSPATIGRRDVKDLKVEYLNRVFSVVDTGSIRPLKVVIDMGNGIEGVVIDDVMARLPVKPEYLFKEPDGRFPNHEANPLKYETLRDLQIRVQESGADVGFAFDGDADRIGLVDEKGEIVPADLVLALVVQEFLRDKPGAKIIYDVKCSRIVRETVEAMGGTPIESVVGRTFVIERMRREGAVFAGELSGHFYFQDLSGFESGDLMLLYVLMILSKSDKKLSELVAPLRKYAHSGEINFEVENKDAVIQRIEKAYGARAISTSHLDGVKIEFPDWWLSVRKSNTEPLLRLVIEADSREAVSAHVAEITAFMK